METSPWNSLEVAKLVVSVSIPLLLVGLGFVVNRAGRRVEEAQWANRKLVERRVELYETMAPRLNALYCFFSLVGHFREISPPKAIELKRELDQEFFVNKFLFGPAFVDLYFEFTNSCFEHFVGVAKDARLRTSPDTQKAERGSEWQEAWRELFSPVEERSHTSDIRSAYESLMGCFAAELGLRGHR